MISWSFIVRQVRAATSRNDSPPSVIASRSRSGGNTGHPPSRVGAFEWFWSIRRAKPGTAFAAFLPVTDNPFLLEANIDGTPQRDSLRGRPAAGTRRRADPGQPAAGGVDRRDRGRWPGDGNRKPRLRSGSSLCDRGGGGHSGRLG